eukprot:scaffold13560_cov122-Alexandrium_tamarense.AAC.4
MRLGKKEQQAIVTQMRLKMRSLQRNKEGRLPFERPTNQDPSPTFTNKKLQLKTRLKCLTLSSLTIRAITSVFIVATVFSNASSY